MLTVSTKQEAALWRYRATPVRVIDGDTIVMTIDLGFHMQLTEPVRLFGINTPELDGPEADKAARAKAFTESLVLGQQLYVETHLYKEREKYGRILATVFRMGDTISVNQKALGCRARRPDEGLTMLRILGVAALMLGGWTVCNERTGPTTVGRAQLPQRLPERSEAGR